MAIYGRTGNAVTVVRRAVLEDVKRLDGRKPDKQDREALANDCYIIVKSFGKERLYHIAYLRADGGAKEIDEAIKSSEASAATTGSTTREAK
jgi:hypothetical protein